MTTLILIRHGYSTSNDKKTFTGQLDEPLTTLGERQSELCAEYVSKNYKVDAIYSSDLKRAYVTAEKLAVLIHNEITESMNLREIYGGSWEGKRFEEIADEFSEDYSVWMNDLGKARCTKGESVKELHDRVNKEIDKIIFENEGKTVAIFTHATPIRAFIVRAMNKNAQDIAQTPWVSNASVSVFKVEGEKITTVLIGENGFQGELVTNLPKTV